MGLRGLVGLLCPLPYLRLNLSQWWRRGYRWQGWRRWVACAIELRSTGTGGSRRTIRPVSNSISQRSRPIACPSHLRSLKTAPPRVWFSTSGSRTSSCMAPRPPPPSAAAGSISSRSRRAWRSSLRDGRRRPGAPPTQLVRPVLGITAESDGLKPASAWIRIF